MIVTQDRIESLKEALTDTAIGIVQGAFLNVVVLPFFKLYPTLGDSFGIAFIFTVFSFTRRYATRRWFNWRLRRKALSELSCL